MKVKIFVSTGDAPKLENEINQWLAENKDIGINHVQQSYAYHDKGNRFNTLMSIWYDVAH